MVSSVLLRRAMAGSAGAVRPRATAEGPEASQSRGRAKLWLLGLAVVVGVGAGAGTALGPLKALLALGVVAVVAGLWKWPQLGAYLIVGLTPLTAGINRGTALPLIRPNEAIAVLVGFALATRYIGRLRTGQLPRPRIDRVELSIVFLALFSSLVPLWWMFVRRAPITSDDLLYALVLWKYLGVYALIRMSVRTERQVAACLWISVGAASIVAVLAILQSLGLFGVPRILVAYFAPFGYANAFQGRGSSTLGLPAATADLMIYNLAIVTGLWMRYGRVRGLLAATAALLSLAALAAGEFSSAIGLIVAVLCIVAVSGSARLLKVFVPVGLVASQVLQPVFAARLSGFQSVSGLPVSWTTRLQNLETYFWPQLFSNWNFVLGVRPSARIVVASQGTGYVWIESGYTWLLWGGGVPLLASFVFFVVVTAKRGWDAARRSSGAVSVAGIATFVAVIVTAVLMLFDPHLTYRGSGDAMFALIALTAVRGHQHEEQEVRTKTDHQAKEVRER